MKIVFVYPPFRHKKFNENISAVDEGFGVYPPLGLAYAAAVLREAGADVDIIDASALKLSKEETLGKLRKARPDVIGFDLHSTYVFFDTLEWIRYFKANFSRKTKTLVGGFNFNLYAEEVMSHDAIDIGLIGAVNAGPGHLLGYLRGENKPESVPGLVYRKGGKTIINRTSKKYCNLEELPFPARDLLPIGKYYSFISKRKNFTVMLAQIGCPFRCTYCAIAPVSHLKRSAGNIFEEMMECYNKYGVREIDFFDGTFTVDKKIVSDLCRMIIDHQLDLEWSCRTRVDCVDRDLLRLMAESGCRKIYYGIESVDSDVLTRIRKDIGMEQVRQTIKLTKGLGIESLCFFMIGNPGDNAKKFRASMRFAKKLGADYIQISRTIAKPKTEMDKELERLTGRNYWRDYMLGKAGEKRLPNPWCEIEEDKIEIMTKRAYMLFYLRPHYLLNRILRVRSLAEFKRYVKTGIKMLARSLIREDS